MKSRQEIKALGKEAMMQQRKISILLVLSIIVLSGVYLLVGRIPAVGFLLAIAASFLLIAWSINVYGEFIKVYKRETASLDEVSSGLKVNFWRKVGGVYWLYLWVFLWSLLLIIPGIVKFISYYFTAYILADCPEVKATDALKLSMRMTQGHKMDIFIFLLSWIGWLILSVLTLGILYIVYVGPYWYTAESGLYLEIRNKAIAEGRITPEELGKTAAELSIG